MTTTPGAHRAEFSVRCACGIEYHTSDAHAGRVLPCKCGRTVTVVRPPLASAAERKREEPRKRRVRKVRRAYSAAPGGMSPATARRWQLATHRVSVTLANVLRPLFTGSPLVRITAAAAWLYLVAMIVAWMMLVFTSERAIPGTLIAYGPRWLALWPLALLVPVALLVTRAALWPLLFAAWVGLVPIMGGRVSLSTLFSGTMPATAAPGTFRVVSFNALRGVALSRQLPEFLGALAPDVLLLQECGDDLWQAFQKQAGWYSARHGTLCTVSHWPVGPIDIMPREEVAQMGGSGLVMRALIDTPNGPLAVVNLHLETARHGLEGMLGREGFIPDGRSRTSAETHYEDESNTRENLLRFARNAAVRDRESALAATFAVSTRSSLPLVIGGDFNLPVESTIFQNHWGGFIDAFEARGNGLGWSKREGRWLRIRIDHLLTLPEGPRPLRVAIGPDYMSDHLPVIVDMAWPAAVARR